MLTLILCVPFGVLLVLEAGARLLGLPSPLILSPAPWNCMRRDGRLGYVFIPSCRGALFETDFRTNAAGLRGPEVRDDGSTRILALGDSCTWGWRVDEREAYPSVLQGLLDRQSGPGHFQILNAGAPGYNSLQGVRLLADRGPHLRPDVIIVGFLWNDAAPGEDAEVSLAGPVLPAQLLGLQEFLLGHSHVFRWLQALVDRRSARIRREQPPATPQVPPERYEDNLRRIAELSGELGARLVFIDWNAGANEDYRIRLARSARDARASMVTYDGPRFDVVHPTPAGYATLAEHIKGVLIGLVATSIVDDATAKRPVD